MARQQSSSLAAFTCRCAQSHRFLFDVRTPTSGAFQLRSGTPAEGNHPLDVTSYVT
jgi:hypothetical protein